jgi:acetyltransferase-like isoleucine patch superfamily enzyme
MTDSKRFKVQSEISGEGESSLRRYQDLVIGSRSWWDLFLYEFVQLFASWIPGALGLLLRKTLYPLILGDCGKGVIFGRDVVLRHPGKIRLGNGVIIDDGVLLDAKGGDDSGIHLEEGVFVGRGSILSCKGGQIRVGARSNIGFHAEVFSSNAVDIGEDVMIAAYVYILGGGAYHTDRTDIPMNQQYDFEGKGGVTIEDDVWVAAHAVVFDGVRISSGTVIGASAVVNQDIPDHSVAVGVPARVISKR